MKYFIFFKSYFYIFVDFHLFWFMIKIGPNKIYANFSNVINC